MLAHGAPQFDKSRRQTLPALTLGEHFPAFSSSSSSVVSLLECGSLSSITSTETHSPRSQLKFHTLDETTSNKDDEIASNKDDETVSNNDEDEVSDDDDKTVIEKADGLSLPDRLNMLTLGPDLALYKRLRSGGKSPTRMFIKNFP
jgi:hypothetical protein